MKSTLIIAIGFILSTSAFSQTWTTFGLEAPSYNCKEYTHITMFNDTLWSGSLKLVGTTLSGVNAPAQLFSCDMSKSDHAGNLWLVGSINKDTWHHGDSYTVYRFDGSKWDDFSLPKSIAYSGCSSIAFQNDGSIWFTTISNGAFAYNGSIWQQYKTSVFTGANSMVIDANGNKWFATTDGLMKFDGTNWTTFNTSNSSLKFNTINDLAVDLNGNVWLAAGSEDETGNETTGRIVKYDGTNWIYFNPFNDNNGLNYVYTIAVDSTGKIWAGTSFGLTVFNGINWTNYTDSHSATEKLEVHSIAFDSHGNKWFGTMCGILKFQDNSAAVNNLHSDKKVAIWPNPTNSYLNIKLFDQSIIDNISVYDSKGSLLVKKENVSMDNFQLNISEFQQGLYFVFVNAGTNRIAKQIFKTK